MTFTERIARFIADERLLTPAAPVAVALSGGADSSALLAVLRALGYPCIALHCHFGLRGSEADRDLQFSRRLAERLGAEFRFIRFDTRSHMRQRRISAEMACRELRYQWFERVRLETGVQAIAVGHHREDNVETFFLNLLRGSGLHGLRAMLPRRGPIVRPLLNVTRDDILDYLRSEQIDYITDSTNADNDFRRNRLRNVVLPLLEREFPGASDAISRSLACLRGNEELYNSLLPQRSDSLRDVSPTLLHEWLSPFGFNPANCRDILASAPGATFVSPSHRLTLCSGGRYVLASLDSDAPAPPRLAGRIIERPSNFVPVPGVLYLDADAIPDSPCWNLRPWRQGDRIRPFGMRGSRPVSDILADAGVPASERRNSYVLTLGDDIIWVVGLRASALYPVTATTRKIIEIYHEETDSDN